MKKLSTLFAVGLFVLGLSFTACSNDDGYVKPETPEHLPSYDMPAHLPEYPAIDPM